MNNTIISVIAAVIIGGGIAGYLVYTNFFATETPTNEQETVQEEPSSVVSDDASVEVEEGGVGLGKGSSSTSTLAPAPDLSRDIVFSDSVSATQREEVGTKINEMVASVTQDPNLFNVWIDLGLLFKTAGDYEGAREAWEYAGVIRPQNSLSFGNLGVLYGYYLNNPLKAEINFLKATQNDPTLIYLHSQIVDFYIDVMNSKEKAIQYIDRIIKENPNNVELQQLRESVN